MQALSLILGVDQVQIELQKQHPAAAKGSRELNQLHK